MNYVDSVNKKLVEAAVKIIKDSLRHTWILVREFKMTEKEVRRKDRANCKSAMEKAKSCSNKHSDKVEVTMTHKER